MLCRQCVFVVGGCFNLGLCASNAVNDQSHSCGRKGVLRLRLLGKEPQLLCMKQLNMSPFFCCIFSPCCQSEAGRRRLKPNYPPWFLIEQRAGVSTLFSRRRLSALSNGRWSVALMFSIFFPYGLHFKIENIISTKQFKKVIKYTSVIGLKLL